MKYFAICFLLISACEENEDLWPPCEVELDNYETIPLFIDSSCSNAHRAAFLEAVDNLNDFTLSTICEPLVEVIGTKTIDHTVETLGENVLACYYVEPDWYADSPLHTATGSGNDFDHIRIFFFKYSIDFDWLVSLTMHELFHYVGISNHTSNEEDIMYMSSPEKLDYTVGDCDHFCADGEYVCTN